jgi:hypothetical protein
MHGDDGGGGGSKGGRLVKIHGVGGPATVVGLCRLNQVDP